MREQRLMKCRYQRRALSAQRNITTAEVADYRDTGMRHNLIVIADL